MWGYFKIHNNTMYDSMYNFFFFLQLYISNVLIAVNPFKEMDKLYSFDIIAKYQDVQNDILPAHVFGIGELLFWKPYKYSEKTKIIYLNKYIQIADEVKRNMSLLHEPHSIIIAGESGSGKTETSKLLLKFFYQSKSTQLAEQIIAANILLESFGNSCTSRNSNSSRFLKTIQVWYVFHNISSMIIFIFFIHSVEIQCALTFFWNEVHIWTWNFRQIWTRPT